MATFGPIASASPNILFDPARVDAQVQGFQRNQLLMQNAQQDQQQQTYQRDTEARIGLARQLVGMPEDQAAAAWGQERQRLQAAGFGRDLPEQFPGLERLKSVAASDLTTFQRLQIEEKRRQSEALAGLFGGVPAAGGASMGGATPGYTPVSMPSAAPVTPATPGTYQGGNGSQAVRADNVSAGAERDRINEDPNLTPEQKQEAMRQISMQRASALTGQPVGTTFRANPGFNGAYEGVAPPAAAPVSGGLTPEQRRLLAVTAQTNPGAVPGLMMQMNQQSSMAADRAADNARQAELLRLQQQTAQRQDEAARRAAAREGIPPGYRATAEGGLEAIPGGPADPEQARAMASARRTGAPIPPFIQKAEQEDIDAIQTASGISSDLASLRGQIDSGKLNFGLVSNAIDTGANFFGADTENSRNLQSYRSTMTRIVNDSLRLNKGVQTDGDAQRAAAELMDNINSPGVVKQRLEELQRLNERAIRYRTQLINRRRTENGLPETDVSPFTNVPASVGRGSGGESSPAPATTTTQASAQGGGWSIRPVQ